MNSWSRFENRDYDRPFSVFLVTLRRFDYVSEILTLISPLLARRRHLARGEGPGTATAGSGPWHCQGGTRDRARPSSRRPPTPAPYRASGARSAVFWTSPRAVAGYRYYPSPGTHPSHTHPGTHPAPPFCASCTPGYGTPGTCTYDRFRTRVGEPRGIEHRPVSGSRPVKYSYLSFTRPFDWV